MDVGLWPSVDTYTHTKKNQMCDTVRRTETKGWGENLSPTIEQGLGFFFGLVAFGFLLFQRSVC